MAVEVLHVNRKEWADEYTEGCKKVYQKARKQVQQEHYTVCILVYRTEFKHNVVGALMQDRTNAAGPPYRANGQRKKPLMQPSSQPCKMRQTLWQMGRETSYDAAQ